MPRHIICATIPLAEHSVDMDRDRDMLLLLLLRSWTWDLRRLSGLLLRLPPLAVCSAAQLTSWPLPVLLQQLLRWPGTGRQRRRCSLLAAAVLVLVGPSSGAQAAPAHAALQQPLLQPHLVRPLLLVLPLR